MKKRRAPPFTVRGSSQIQRKDNRMNDEVNSYKAFDMELLPGVLRSYLSECMLHAPGVDPLMVFVPFLSTTAALLNKNIYIDNYGKIYPNLWTLVIAPSGSYKSTAMRLGSQLALGESSKFQSSLLSVENQLQELNKLSVSEKKGERDKIKELEQARLELIALNPIMSDKGSTEGFLQAMHDGQKATIFSTEASVFLSQFQKEYNADLKPQFMKAYDCNESLDHLTRTTKRLYIEEPYLGFCGASTFETITPFFTPTDMLSGFTVRMLLFSFERSNTEQVYLAKQKTISNMFNKQIMTNIESIKQGGERSYSLKDEAAEFYVKICELITGFKHESDRVNRYLKAFKTRWITYILKISLLMEALGSPYSKELSQRSLLVAYSIVTRAMQSTVQIIEEYVELSKFQLSCNRVYKWVEQRFALKGSAITYADILNAELCDGTLREMNSILSMLCAQEKLAPVDLKDKDSPFLDLELYANFKDYSKVAYCPVNRLVREAMDIVEKEKDVSLVKGLDGQEVC